MFCGDTNAVFHIRHQSAAATPAKNSVMSRVIVADILGHASLSNTAYYPHSKTDELLDIASCTLHMEVPKCRVVFGRPFLSKGDSGHVHRETNDLWDAAG